MYHLPIVIVTNDTELEEHDTKGIGLCKDSWNDVGSVNVAVGRDLDLRIVAIGASKSHQSQGVAVILSDDKIDDDNSNVSYVDAFGTNGTVTGEEQIKNVTCLVDVLGKIHLHVFTTPGDTVQTEDDDQGLTKTTRQSKTKTTEPTPDQTKPYPPKSVTVPSDKSKFLRVGLITVITVIVITCVTLLLTYLVTQRKRGCCWSSGNHAPQAAANDSLGSPLGIVPLNSWMISGPAVSVDVNPDPAGSGGEMNPDAQIPSDEHEYGEIPDEYYNYYNTRPALLQHYWEIQDEYYNYENTGTRPLSVPLSLQVPLPPGQDGDDDDVYTFYASGAVNQNYQEPTRQRAYSSPSYQTSKMGKGRARNLALLGKYGRLERGFRETATGMYEDKNQEPTRQRENGVPSYETPAIGQGRARDLALLGKYGKTQIGFREKATTSRMYQTNKKYQGPKLQRENSVPSYGTSAIGQRRARDLALLGKYARTQRGLRNKANRLYLVAHTLEPPQNSTQQNTPSSQVPNTPIAIAQSKDDLWETCEIVRRDKVKRSQTF
ncbi:hypothetical protein Bbelb_189580 [Branchiostoma belcheri]|nr:hypothetical protein Bbelb_189580 [Branchiostoma belcheri]